MSGDHSRRSPTHCGTSETTSAARRRLPSRATGWNTTSSRGVGRVRQWRVSASSWHCYPRDSPSRFALASSGRRASRRHGPSGCRPPDRLPANFHRDGEPIGDFRKVWKRACAAIGLPGRLVHDLRCSGIKHLIDSGIDPYTVMVFSGHRTPSMLRRYHIIDLDDLRRAAAKASAHRAESGGARNGSRIENPQRTRRVDPRGRAWLSPERANTLESEVEPRRVEPRTEGSRSDPRTQKTHTCLPRLSCGRPTRTAIWAPGAQN
jgi:hypothetical protein